MRKRVSRYSRIVFVLFVALTGVWNLHSQSTTSLRGTITDAQGAVIPGAVVTLTDRDKGASRQIVTDAVGSYAFLQLSPGTYTLKVENPGFSTATRDNLKLLVNTPATLDLRLDGYMDQ